MNSAHFDIYRDQVVSLTRSLLIKFEDNAKAVNTGLERRGLQIDYDNPYSWKYYLNRAGEYHSSDKLMYVISLDRPDLGRQLFDKDLLEENRLTRENYAYGTRYYLDLVERFPDQVDLINGMLNPVDLDLIVEARDGLILSYDTSLVEPNEENLIPKLQEYVDVSLQRWYNRDYTRSESLYWPSTYATLMGNIASQILSIRLENCRTNYAHSYHVTRYLDSHHRLGEFIPYMTLDQKLWFYRNIRHIQHSVGKTSTFNTLVEQIFTTRRLPLKYYDLIQTVPELGSEYTSPETLFNRNRVNLKGSDEVDDYRSLRSTILKEAELTNLSTSEAEHYVAQITKDLEHTADNQYLTKILECAVVDRTDSVPFTLEQCLLDHWLLWIGTNQYLAQIPIVLPTTGEQHLVSAKDAFFLYYYSWVRGTLGLELDTIPTAGAINAIRPKPPTYEQLRAVTDPKYVPDLYIEEALKIGQPHTKTVYDAELFYRTCSEIQTQQMKHYWLYANRTHYHARAQTEYMTSMFYQYTQVEYPESGRDYSSYLEGLGLDLEDFTQLDYLNFSVSIYRSATGAGINTSGSLRELQRAMVGLMSRLISYNTQILTTINNSGIIELDERRVRVGYDQGDRDGFHQIVTIPVSISKDGVFKGGMTLDKPDELVPVKVNVIDSKMSDVTSVTIPVIVNVTPLVEDKLMLNVPYPTASIGDVKIA